MNEKNLSPTLDAALAKVNPERRRFLGILLAGAAALPLLTSADLAAGEGSMGGKEEKCGPPASPTFSPAAGTYPSAQKVTINAPSGATIYYTTDGSTPTTLSKKYTGPITASSTETIKAITVPGCPGPPSSVATATYTITTH